MCNKSQGKKILIYRIIYKNKLKIRSLKKKSMKIKSILSYTQLYYKYACRLAYIKIYFSQKYF